MIYFTQPGDSIESVAAKFAGGNDADFAKQLALFNQNSFAVQSGGGEFLAPNYAVWIPDEDEVHTYTCDAVLNQLDWLTPFQRHHMALAQKDGLDIHDIIGVHKLVTVANQRTQSPDIGLIGGAFAATTLDRAADLRNIRLEEFNKILDELKENLKAMANAPTSALRATASSQYKANVQSLNQQFAYELKQFKLKGEFILRKPRQLIREYKAQGWNIGNIEIAKDAQRAGRCLNRLVTGLWVLDISNGVADTIQAYREHKDWVGEAIKSVEEIAIPKGVGLVTEDVIIAGLDITAVGWVGTLAVAGLEAGISIYLEYKIDKK